MQNARGLRKLVEDVIDGIVSFLYDVISALFLLWWKPVRTASRLSGTADSEAVPHISSSILLFVGAAAVGIDPFINLEFVRGLMRSTQENKWYQYALSIVTVYIVLDLLSRIFAHLFVPSESRSEIQGVIRYGVAASCVLLRAIFELLFNLEDRFSSWMPWSQSALFAYFFVLVGLYPLWACLSFAVRRRAGRVLSIVTGLIGALIFAAAAAAATLFSNRANEDIFAKRPYRITIERSACILRWDGTVSVVAEISNEGDDSIFVPIDLFAIALENSVGKKTHVIDALVDRRTQMSSMFEVLPARASGVVHLIGAVRANELEWPIAETDRCSVRAYPQRMVGFSTIYSSATPTVRFVPQASPEPARTK
jgi:hypothetical protein